MYINDLGIGRAGSVPNHSNRVRTANSVSGKSSYSAAMEKAVDRQKTTVNSACMSAEDIIVREAVEKMKTDPEWEESVMNKVKEFYADRYRAGGTQASYLNWMAQSLLSGQNGLGLGLTGYSPYGFSSLAAAAYGSVMDGAFGGSLFGNWQL